jgi:hypothetical protein
MQTEEAQVTLQKAAAWQEKYAPGLPELIRLRIEATPAANSQ